MNDAEAINNDASDIQEAVANFTKTLAANHGMFNRLMATKVQLQQ